MRVSLHRRAGSRELVLVSLLTVALRCDARRRRQASPHPVGCPSPGCKQEKGARRPDMHALALLLFGLVSGPRLVPLICEDVQGRGRAGAKHDSCTWEPRTSSASAPSRHRCLRFGGAAQWAISAHARGRCMRTNAYKNAREGQRGAGGSELACCPQDASASRTAQQGCSESQTSRHAVPRGSSIPSALNLQCAWVPLVALPCTITAVRRYRLLPKNALTRVGAGK
ncbi:hypothetical protein K438DRAFT_1876663 [Mycena galopus ATCC 62051]|nr:hypothetical protein K438DRAFT_1876663 [Mycena galopus ATCC 62051]